MLRKTLLALGCAVLLAVGVVAGLAALALANLEQVLAWSLERLLPNTEVVVKRVRLQNWNELDVTELELKSAATGDRLIVLDGGRMKFAYRKLLGGQLEEIELTSPRVRIAPDFINLLRADRGDNSNDAPTERSVPDSWAVRHLIIHDARLLLPASEQLPLDLRARFSLDWRDLDISPDHKSEPLEIRIDEVSATWTDAEDAAARIQEIDLAFTLAGIFVDRRIERIRVASGAVRLAADSWQAIREHLSDRPDSPDDSASAAAPDDRWVVGSFSMVGIAFELTDLPDPLQSARFTLDLEAPDAGGDGQISLIIRDPDLLGTAQQDPPLFAANEIDLRFTLPGVRAGHIDYIEIKNPAIHLGGAAPSTEPSVPTDLSGIPNLTFGQILVQYGEFTLDTRATGGPLATARFAFDLRGSGTAPEVSETPQAITLWDVQVRADPDDPQPILGVDAATVGFTVREALDSRHIREVTTSGGRLRIGDALARLMARINENSDRGTTEPVDGSQVWTVGKLDVSGIRTRLDDIQGGISDIFLTINSEFRDVPLGLAASDLLDEVHTLEFADFEIRSPVNRAVRILTLRSVFVRFTINELLRSEIREVVILRPTIYLNQDLFIYMEQQTQRNGQSAPPGEGMATARNWRIGELEAKFGRLVIGAGTDRDVGLPLGFETRVQNLSFENLADLQIDAALQIPRQSYVFETYQIELIDVEGDLQFSYPPEAGVQNLVQKLDIHGIRWRQFEAGASWISVTFDRQGINGLFGGELYTGYLNGGFSFFFQNQSPWIGWISGSGIDTSAITEVISPQNFQMTGPLDFDAQVDAFSANIDRVIANFSITEPGEMKITRLDDLIARIPDTWTAIRQSSARIGLETLRDYAYTEAGGRLWFVRSQGVLNLDLDGPTGKRTFEFVLHDGDASAGLWQTGTLGKTDDNQ